VRGGRKIESYVGVFNLKGLEISYTIYEEGIPGASSINHIEVTKVMILRTKFPKIIDADSFFFEIHIENEIQLME